MRSRKPKVLHGVSGRPMVVHVLAAVRDAGAGRMAVVTGPQHEEVAGFAREFDPSITICVQAERRGTAHAVLAARNLLQKEAGRTLVVLFGDTPLVRPSTITALEATVAAGAAVAVLGFEARDPTGYGRIVRDAGGVAAIVEHRDATEEQRKIGFCNAGLMAMAGAHALALLEAIADANDQKEFYLTDAVTIARGLDLPVAAVTAPEDEVMGVNDRVQLAMAERLMQIRLREAAMRAGVTMIDPGTVTLCYDTTFGRDVTIEPNVMFGPGVTIADGVMIRAFSHLEGAVVERGAQIGPFARLRPGTRVGEKAKIGNFVETKAASFGRNAKVSHLSYVGDATVGEDANIGAGTITCNYDGFRKHRTAIGAGAFIGSNSALVAPVTIGDGAIVAAGSVVTKNVKPDALAVGRGQQTAKEGWAARFREAHRKK